PPRRTSGSPPSRGRSPSRAPTGGGGRRYGGCGAGGAGVGGGARWVPGGCVRGRGERRRGGGRGWGGGRRAGAGRRRRGRRRACELFTGLECRRVRSGASLQPGIRLAAAARAPGARGAGGRRRVAVWRLRSWGRGGRRRCEVGAGRVRPWARGAPAVRRVR